jgi:hypothetical protein
MDGVTLTERKKGFETEVRQVALQVNVVHCMIYREALASCNLQPQLHTELQEALKVMNLVKACPLNYRQIAVLYEEI